mmetsp:Transcript_52956/g.125044  ORF Transcript_52956/g.125044 Transcript_52956/m.125044 type:complete len:325 (-) Transcript_52956:194-1168(-)
MHPNPCRCPASFLPTNTGSFTSLCLGRSMVVRRFLAMTERLLARSLSVTSKPEMEWAWAASSSLARCALSSSSPAFSASSPATRFSTASLALSSSSFRRSLSLAFFASPALYSSFWASMSAWLASSVAASTARRNSPHSFPFTPTRSRTAWYSLRRRLALASASLAAFTSPCDDDTSARPSAFATWFRKRSTCVWSAVISSSDLSSLRRRSSSSFLFLAAASAEFWRWVLSRSRRRARRSRSSWPCRTLISCSCTFFFWRSERMRVRRASMAWMVASVASMPAVSRSSSRRVRPMSSFLTESLTARLILCSPSFPGPIASFTEA